MRISIRSHVVLHVIEVIPHADYITLIVFHTCRVHTNEKRLFKPAFI
jgi:hypothetical protein